ncbi:hypothetical protein [Shinella sp. DD12]|jgi:Zn ribbon nucleic-acid-binding protein|uniref:hypothetical protein n=1 Tax=unclassified Shinella TaxID=2643062 RepID=UPI000437AF38|nr:hypothetical protein [Shinella sp. DD12]EYR81402.1 hypothetical protein SHLA_15c000870 [Shinella sp. DD12]
MRVSLSVHMPRCPTCLTEDPAVWETDDGETVECRCGASHSQGEWLVDKLDDGIEPLPAM